MNSAKGFAFVIIYLLGLFALGTLGFHFLEGHSYFESFYLTAATITTVGYGDIHPQTVPARMLSIFLMLSGITVAASILGVSLNYFIEGRLWSYIGVRRMKKKIEEIENHYIICGVSDVSKGIADIFSVSDIPFVIIEQDGDRVEQIRQEGMLVVEGDATTDDALLRAGIRRARGLVTPLMDDAENLYISLSARNLNPEIKIVARATSPRASDKLYKVGVNTVISLSSIGARRMAEALLHPEVVGFMEILTEKGKSTMRLEAFQIREKSNLIGKTISDAKRTLGDGLQIVAIKREQSYLTSPSENTKILMDDVLIFLGEEKYFGKLDELL